MEGIWPPGRWIRRRKSGIHAPEAWLIRGFSSKVWRWVNYDCLSLSFGIHYFSIYFSCFCTCLSTVRCLSSCLYQAQRLGERRVFLPQRPFDRFGFGRRRGVCLELGLGRSGELTDSSGECPVSDLAVEYMVVIYCKCLVIFGVLFFFVILHNYCLETSVWIFCFVFRSSEANPRWVLQKMGSWLQAAMTARLDFGMLPSWQSLAIPAT